MSPERWRKVADIFEKVLEVAPAERAAFIASTCGEDPGLIADVEYLLRQHEQAADFLEKPHLPAPNSIATSTQSPEHGASDEGLEFGPYTTVRRLGEGGMGVVYLARQEKPISRLVALKVIKPGLASVDAVWRFSAERQALALMDHPNIARVYDAGTAADGRPYFVMEYVEGDSITDFCDAQQLTTSERLQLFRQVCLAVHHAHQKGVIHRDIKPSNVLVSIKDGQHVPKIIDFGIAKALNQGSAEQTMFTEKGMLIGTPEYMSPEQASAGASAVDASSDIYSLGVLLYELVVGVLPFDPKQLRRAGFGEILRIIRDEEPPPPTGRLRGLGAGMLDVAKRRRTDPTSLIRELRGDLEWIAMKAIEKDQARRYSSAAELAAEITRHLSSEPVLAGPPTWKYRVGKYVRKHRLEVGAASALSLSIVAGLVISTALWLREQHQRDVAERSAYAAHLANAQTHIAEFRYELAQKALFLCPPRLRGWEWRLLLAQSDNTIASMVNPGDFHNDDIYAPGFLTYSPDSKRLYSGMARTVHVWDTATWQAVAHYGPYGKILGLMHDGSLAATGSLTPGNSDVSIIEPATGRQVALLSGHLGIFRVEFTRDGSKAVSVAKTGMRVWALPSGKLTVAAEGPEFATRYPRAAFSLDGKTVAYGQNSNVLLVDASTGRVTRKFGPYRGLIHFAVFTADGGRLLVAPMSQSFVMIDLATGNNLWDSGDNIPLMAQSFYPQSNRMVGLAHSGAVKVWDTINGKALSTLTGGCHFIYTVAVSPDGRLAACGGRQGQIRIWDARTEGGQVLGRGYFVPRSVPITTSGKALVLENAENVALVDSVTGETSRRCAIPKVFSFDFDPSGETFTAGDAQGRVASYRTSDCSQTTVFRDSGPPVGVVQYSARGDLLAAGDSTGAVTVWRTESRSQLSAFRTKLAIATVRFSPDGTRLATGEGVDYSELEDPSIHLWEAATGRHLRAFPDPVGNMRARTVAFSGDGRNLIAGTPRGRIFMWDTANGNLIRETRGPGDVEALALSPDGRMLASSHRDNTIRLWDATTLDPIFAIREPFLIAMGLSFTHAGDRLLATSMDRTLRSFHTQPAYSVEALEAIHNLQKDLPTMADVRVALASGKLDRELSRQAMRLADTRVDMDPEIHYETTLKPLLKNRASGAALKPILDRAEDAARLGAWSVEAWATLGIAYFRSGRYTDAVAPLSRATAVSDEPYVAAFLAAAQAKAGKIEEAKLALAKAEKLLMTASPVLRWAHRSAIEEAKAILPKTLN